MATAPATPVVQGITHHRARVNGTILHYAAAGTTGSPVLLVHGFPETWRAFRKVIPLLAGSHRVFAVDLRGFGDSDTAPDDYDSKAAAEDLHQLIAHLGLGPVHLTGQDVSGAIVFRLAVTHPQDVLSLTAIETGLPGFGWEALADVAHGGAWHIGVSRADRARARGRRRRRALHGRHHVPGRPAGDQFRPARRCRPLRRDGGPRGAGEGRPRLRRRHRRRLGA